MLIWLILIPVIAAACIGLLRTPGRATALLSAGLTLVLGLCAVLSPTDCGHDCLSSFCGMPLQLSLALPLSRIMLLLTVLVTFAAVLGLKAPDKDAARSWAISALLLSAGATGAFLSDNIIAFYGFHELALIPTFVMIGCYGRGNRRTIAWTATLYLGLASRSSSVVFQPACGCLPRRTVSTTVNGKVSDEEYGTYPTCFATSLSEYSLTSFPSRYTVPLVGVRILFMQWMSVDFPTPLGPRIETTCAPSISRVMSSRTGVLP